MNDNLIGSFLPLLIAGIGLIIIVFGKNSSKVLKYLFAPVFWIAGNLLRLAVLLIVGFLAFSYLPGFLGDVETRFAYPVGSLDSNGRRYGQGWRVSQDFADTINPESPSTSGEHLGEDWVPATGGAVGEPVYSIGEGRVIRNERNNSYGHVLMIQYQSPSTNYPYVTALYGHIRPNSSLGTTVRPGQEIGTIATRSWNGCNSGCNFAAPGCTPRAGSGKSQSDCHGWNEHLHFELRSPAAIASPGFGYSETNAGFLNPTNAGSSTANQGGGWVDRWRY